MELDEVMRAITPYQQGVTPYQGGGGGAVSHTSRKIQANAQDNVTLMQMLEYQGLVAHDSISRLMETTDTNFAVTSGFLLSLPQGARDEIHKRVLEQHAVESLTDYNNFTRGLRQATARAIAEAAIRDPSKYQEESWWEKHFT
jgi:hypothetical protein